MDNYKWHTFVRKIHVKAPMKAIYNAWATSGGICTWFLRSCIITSPSGEKRAADEPAQVGDSYAWEWYNWEVQEEGKVIEANGKDRFAFTFGGDPVVLVALSKDKDTTLVTLTQSNMPEDDKNKMELYYGCGTGWTFWLANLKAWLEHDVLLHDRSDDFIGKHQGFEFVNM